MKLSLLLFTLLLAGAAPLALSAPQSDVAGPATAPATQPAEDFAALIHRLGDDDFHVRQEATRKLKAAGKAAVPALQQARKAPDAEIRTRVEELLLEIETPVVVAQPVPQATGMGNQSMSVSINNGGRVVDVHQPGRYIHIEENATGIAMKVTGQLDGKEVTREYKARDAAHLQKENPEAFALYRQSAGGFAIHGGGGGMVANLNVRINGGAGIVIQPGPVVIPQDHVIRDGNILRLNQKLLDEMKAANIPDGKQEEVKGLIKQLQETSPQANPDKSPNARMRDYNTQSDALRKLLEELKLPDPGELLPPPAAARLGISTVADAQGQGIVITHVQPDSRAAKIGLKEQDVIQKINGNDIHTSQELRKNVLENAKGLVIEGVRDGKPFKIDENAK